MLMEALLNAAKEKEVCQKLDDLNFTVRETKWVLLGMVYHGLDGALTVEEMIASVITAWIVMLVGSILTAAWRGFKGGFSRAWTRRKETQKLKVMRNA
jgi:hypothetical protein